MDQVALTRQGCEHYVDFLAQRRSTPVSPGSWLQRFEWVTFFADTQFVGSKKTAKGKAQLYLILYEKEQPVFSFVRLISIRAANWGKKKHTFVSLLFLSFLLSG